MKSKQFGGLDFDFGIEDISVTSLPTMPLPSPELFLYYGNLRDRHIVLNDIIDDSLLDYTMYIMQWNRDDMGKEIKDRKPIWIYINSDGGELYPTMNLADVIQASKTPVYTVGMGRAFSSGGLILIAGHKRFIFKNTSCLIHDGTTGAIGDAGKVFDTIDFNKALDSNVSKFILEHTKIPEDVLEKNYRRDWFLMSADMIKYGIADVIVENLEEIYKA